MSIRRDCLHTHFGFHLFPSAQTSLQQLTYGGTDICCNQIDENCTNKINKNQTVLSLLWLYPVKRKLRSLPDDATINEIPLIDCFKPLWRLERGQCSHDQGRKKEILLGSASKTGTDCETKDCLETDIAQDLRNFIWVFFCFFNTAL